MNIYILITTLLLSIFGSVNHMLAQVSIGEGKKPESFSVLQIDGTEGGLRLPQLTLEEVNSLKTKLNALPPADQAEAKGLLIYSMDKNEIEFWDGDNWAIVGSAVVFENGISKNLTTNTVELGGSLVKDTEININDQKLNFTANTTSKWTVNNTLFEVVNGAVNITPASFNVMANTLSIVKDEDVKLNGVITVSNSKNTLTINNGVVKIEGQLKYENESKANGKVLTAGYSGKAYWDNLRKTIQKVEGLLKGDGTVINTGSSFATVINSTPLQLKAGKWLIFAKITAQITKSNGSHLWLSLRDNAEPTKIICSVGGDVDQGGYSTPQFTYFMIVAETRSYNLVAATNNTGTKLISNAIYGQPYFYAILIDEPQSGN